MKIIQDYWVVISSLAVVVLSGLGTISAYYFYSFFGINYFLYSDASDVFMIIFRLPIFFYSFIAVTTLSLLYILILALKKHTPSLTPLYHSFKVFISKNESYLAENKLTPLKRYPFKAFIFYIKYFSLFYILIILITIFLILAAFIFFPAVIFSQSAESLKNGYSSIQTVHYNKDEKLNCVISLGGTSNSLFYWDLKTNNSVVIPTRKIIKIVTLLQDPKIDPYGYTAEYNSKVYREEVEEKISNWKVKLKKNCQTPL